MAFPTGIKIFIDDVDVTYYVCGANTWEPTPTTNLIRDLDITPFLRKPMSPMRMTDRNYKGDMSVSDTHTVKLTALDGNGRVECRVEVR
jgi:hypothetical protein